MRGPYTPSVDLLATTTAGAPGAPLVLAFHGQWEDECAWPTRLGDRLGEAVDGGERGAAATWVFPRGPYEDAAERRGRTLEGYSWYRYTGEKAAFARSLRETGGWVLDLLDRTLAETGADAGRVILLGFSQGGYLAGSMALLWPELFAGAGVFGARFKTELLDGDFASLRGGGLRLFSAHGERDRSVKPEPAARCVETLRDAGVDIVHHAYRCGHRVLPEMIDDALAHLLPGRPRAG